MFSLCTNYPSYLERMVGLSTRLRSTNFVPKHKPPKEEDVNKLEAFLSLHNTLLILTGAGISTESGIPDYRSEGVGLYARSTNRPVQFRDFLKSEDVRRRYWARNYVGWPRFSSTVPNLNHFAITNLQNERNGKCFVVTQNVDGLHLKAGCQNLTELHGTAYKIICLGCPYFVDRHTFQLHLASLNPHLCISDQAMRPDGDVEMKQEDVQGFIVPPCPSCGGVLKPDIVFFGDNVPKSRVETVKSNVLQSDALLVLGSSLTVFSAYRIVLQASDLQKPIAVVNIGQTRGDELVSLKLDAKCGDVLPKLLKRKPAMFSLPNSSR